MIQFTMKILGYSAGSYSVEYIPKDDRCSPIKLNILLESETTKNKDLVLAKLKASSPQNYWLNQIASQSSGTSDNVANELVNTQHEVSEIMPLPVNPVTSFYSAPNNFYGSESINNIPTQLAPSVPNAGQTTPEEVADLDSQHAIKLKIIIQQVLQEMAEGTV